MKKIKDVPMGTTKSVAALVCPLRISRSLLNERPSSWYNYINKLNYIKLSVEQIRER